MITLQVFDPKWVSWDLIRQIRNRINDIEIDIPEWNYKKRKYHNLSQYEVVESGMITLGSIWDGEYTYVFEYTFIVPQELQDKNIVLQCTIGGEGEVYINGKAISSLDPIHSNVPITSNGKAGDIYEITIKATKHLHDSVRYERIYDQPYPDNIFKETKIASINKQVEEFYYLAELLLQICVLEEDEKITNKIYGILKDELFNIEYHSKEEAFVSSIRKGYEQLLHRVKALEIPKKYGKMIFTGHSHLDLVFKWREKETIRKVERTCSNTLGVLDRHKEGIFTQSQMKIFEYAKQYYPRQFEEMCELIQEGKIEPVGSLWTEFDSNIPSGESLIRQILYGKQFSKENFNKESKVCFLPDTFGFTGILPQILVKSGFSYFVTSKLAWNENNEFPYNYFMWKGIDGSSIKSYQMPKGYAGEVGFSAVLQNYNKSKQKEDLDIRMFQYGAGDGGGGISDEMMHYKDALKKIDAFIEVQDGSLEHCMQEIDLSMPSMPEFRGELYFEKHRGVYTSQAKIKKYNRKCEALYHNAEFFAVLADMKGAEYPFQALKKGWEIILLNQFHDILAGTCITSAIEDVWKSYEDCISIGNSIIYESESYIQQKGEHILVWNPTGWSRIEIIRVQVPNMEYTVYDGDKPLAYQVIRQNEENTDILVKAVDIPSFGYKQLKIKAKHTVLLQENEQMYGDDHSATQNLTLENEIYKICFDQVGEMESIYDKKAKRQVLRGKGNVLEAFIDRSGYFDSWDIAPDFEHKRFVIQDVKEMKIVEAGPLRWTMKVEKKFKNSCITQYISIYSHTQRIDFKTQMDYYDPHILLKAAFEVDVDAPYATYDCSLGNVERPTTANNPYELTQFEVPMQKYMDLSQADYGVSILNDSKYGCDIKGNKMRITLLKTATYPDPVQDMGHHEFMYSLYPHTQQWKHTNMIEEAYALNTPCVLTKGEMEKDTLSFIEVNSDSIVVEQIKKAEKNDGIILRLYESKGIKNDIQLTLAYEIQGVVYCDLMENEIRRLDFSNNLINIEAKPYEIITLKVILKDKQGDV